MHAERVCDTANEASTESSACEVGQSAGLPALAYFFYFNGGIIGYVARRTRAGLSRHYGLDLE